MGGPFSRILVPVDFLHATDQLIADGLATKVDEDLHIEVSPASNESIRLATGLCSGGGDIRLVHATPALDHTSLYGGSRMGNLAGAIEEIHEGAKAVALRCLEHLGAKHEGQYTMTSSARHGVALDVVLSEARDFDADLIIVAASGRSRVSRFFLGSTADRIIRQSECPVLVVPTERE